MAIKGQILTNPDTGDIYEFLETAKDTNGEYIKVKMTLNTKGELVPNHFHVLQDESFEILSGNMTVWLDNKLQTVASGNSIFFA
jgi:quercetin dioxygenase-like cupin family protein